MRVAHVITKLDVGGAQTHVVELALGQAAAGHHVDVIAGRGGPAAEQVAAGGVAVTVVPELGGSYGRLSQRHAVRAVTNAVRAVRPDVVHGHSSNGGLAARFAARRLGLPAVYTAHGWPFQRGAAWRQRVLSFVGEFIGGHLGDAVIVLTETERRRARRARIAPDRRLWVVPNGVRDVPAALRRSARATNDRPVMVMVARFAPPKQQADFVRILGELADLEWTLQFVGDGPDRPICVEATRALGLEDRVEFLGHRDDVPALLAAADLGVLWSRYEGLPISVIEYLRAGLCCVVSDLAGTRDLLGDPPAGVFSPSPAELRRLLADASERDRLGDLARTRYEASYSAEVMIAKTDQVYAAVLDGRA